jgi:hypothetical protein
MTLKEIDCEISADTGKITVVLSCDLSFSGTETELHYSLH